MRGNQCQVVRPLLKHLHAERTKSLLRSATRVFPDFTKHQRILLCRSSTPEAAWKTYSIPKSRLRIWGGKIRKGKGGNERRHKGKERGGKGGKETNMRAKRKGQGREGIPDQLCPQTFNPGDVTAYRALSTANCLFL